LHSEPIVRKIVLIFCLLFINFNCFGLTYSLPSNGGDVVGKVQWTRALPGDTFITIGRRYDIGYFELVEANPGIDPENLQPGTIIVVPTKFVVPQVPHTGMVLNIAELRIYYFPPDGHEVMTYPVGIGREGWNTPVGVSKITGKVKDPTWYVPESIHKWRAKDGVTLPPKVGPGPNNPLGAYKMLLGFHPGDYRMHGTNDPTGIGRRSSSGCIRLWNEDVEELYNLVHVGTRVRVMNDPYKAGRLNNKIYLESHTPLEEEQKIYDKDLTPMRYDIQAVVHGQNNAKVNWDRANEVASQQNGIPQVVGELQ
jgi:L,D-transpeptidase ErfK/SrfK